jgi:parvulin-like peptidyl-prolyl isomerase
MKNARNERSTRRSVAFATAAVLVAAACSRTASAADVVARVGGTDVTADELKAYVETLGAQEQAALAKDSSLLAQVVRSYLARQAVLKEARARKWDQDPVVKVRLDRVRDQALTELYLQSVSAPPDGYPTTSEVQAAYDANQAAFKVPKQYRLAQIFIADRGADKEGKEPARKRVDGVVRKLEQKGADFGDVARAESDEKDVAARRGEIGWLSESQVVAGIRSAVTALAKGAVSDPIRFDDGWHILKLLDTKAPSTRPLAEVRETIVAQLRAERAKANRQAYLAELLDKSPPAINELALAKLLARTK